MSGSSRGIATRSRQTRIGSWYCRPKFGRGRPTFGHGRPKFGRGRPKSGQRRPKISLRYAKIWTELESFVRVREVKKLDK